MARLLGTLFLMVVPFVIFFDLKKRSNAPAKFSPRRF